MFRFMESAGFEKVRFRRQTLPHERWFDEGDELEGDYGIEKMKAEGVLKGYF